MDVTEDFEINVDDLYSLQEVARNWNGVKASKPRILVRVLKKAKLFSYARPNVNEKWPFQVQLIFFSILFTISALIYSGVLFWVQEIHPILPFMVSSHFVVCV